MLNVYAIKYDVRYTYTAVYQHYSSDMPGDVRYTRAHGAVVYVIPCTVTSSRSVNVLSVVIIGVALLDKCFISLMMYIYIYIYIYRYLSNF